MEYLVDYVEGLGILKDTETSMKDFKSRIDILKFNVLVMWRMNWREIKLKWQDHKEAPFAQVAEYIRFLLMWQKWGRREMDRLEIYL